MFQGALTLSSEGHCYFAICFFLFFANLIFFFSSFFPAPGISSCFPSCPVVLVSDLQVVIAGHCVRPWFLAAREIQLGFVGAAGVPMQTAWLKPGFLGLAWIRSAPFVYFLPTTIVVPTMALNWSQTTFCFAMGRSLDLLVVVTERLWTEFQQNSRLTEDSPLTVTLLTCFVPQYLLQCSCLSSALLTFWSLFSFCAAG